MADNETINSIPWATYKATNSGDAGQNYQLVGLAFLSGPADSKTAVDFTGDATNGLDVDVTRVQGTVITQLQDSAGADLTSARGAAPGGARYLAVQRSCDCGRQEVMFSATNVAAGTTGTETLITLQRVVDQAAAVAANSYAIPAGKRLRITSATFASRGHATATAQVTTFSLRMNTAGAITTASPARFAARVATPATSNAWDRFEKALGDGYEIAGDGTLQIGVTANAVYVTNAPTWDVFLTGYLY